MGSTPIGSVPGACRSTRLTGPESLCRGPWTDSGGTHRFVFAAPGALLDGLPDNLLRIEPCRSRARARGLSDGTTGRTGHVGPRWFHLRPHRRVGLSTYSSRECGVGGMGRGPWNRGGHLAAVPD